MAYPNLRPSLRGLASGQQIRDQLIDVVGVRRAALQVVIHLDHFVHRPHAVEQRRNHAVATAGLPATTAVFSW